MNKIRRGKDIHVTWEVLTDGVSTPLVEDELTLEIKNPSMTVVQRVTDFTVLGNVIRFTWYGKQQPDIPRKYFLTLWKNKGKTEQSAVDTPFVELVAASWDEEDDEVEDLQTEYVELEAGNFGWSTIKKPYYNMLAKRGKFLHEIQYDVIDYEYAYKYFKQNAPEAIGACTSFRYGNYYGRNLDWYDNKEYAGGQPDFVIYTPETDVHRPVMGVASVPGMTEHMATCHQQSELWRILPFYLYTGYNGKVFANLNVVPQDKGDNSYSVPTVEQRDEISTSMLVRYVVDKFDSALEACQYIRQYVRVFQSVKLQEMGYESHFMIGDGTSTYVLEIVDNEVVFHESNKMTNFFIDGVEFLPNGKVYTNADAADGNLPSSLGITEHGSGLERYNILVDAAPQTRAQMRQVMNSLLYSKTYDLTEDPYWYSEFVSPEHGVTVDTPPDDEAIQYMVEAAQEIKEGTREGTLWITKHSAVIDLQEKTMEIVSFEDTDTPYIFNFR